MSRSYTLQGLVFLTRMQLGTNPYTPRCEGQAFRVECGLAYTRSQASAIYFVDSIGQTSSSSIELVEYYSELQRMRCSPVTAYI